MKSQLDGLLHEQFLSATPWSWLSHYPRYLEGVTYRLDKVRSGGGERDAIGRGTIDRLMRKWQETLPESSRNPAGLASEEFRWMLEELRVSLFAQPLGTSMKVSESRLEKWPL